MNLIGKKNYEPTRIDNAFKNNQVEIEFNGDKNKMVSTKDDVTSYLNFKINDLKTKGEQKINYQWQLTACLLKILMKHVLWIKRVISKKLL